MPPLISEAPAAQGRGRPGLLPVDWLAALLVVAFGAASLALRGGVQLPWLWEPVFLGCLALFAYGTGAAAFLQVRRRGLKARPALAMAWASARQGLRTVGPYLVGILAFEGLRTLTPHASRWLADGALAAADHWLLGEHVGVLAERYGRPWLTAVLIPAYGLHLPTVPLIVMFFQGRGQAQAARETAAAMLVLCLIGVVGYYTVPAVGPYVYQAELYPHRFPASDTPLVGRGLALIDRARGVARDCFPSLHVAHVLVIGAFLRRHARLAFRLYLPFGLAVIAATMYLRVHYLVDVLAGIPAGVASVWLGTRLQERHDGQGTS